MTCGWPKVAKSKVGVLWTVICLRLFFNDVFVGKKISSFQVAELSTTARGLSLLTYGIWFWALFGLLPALLLLFIHYLPVRMLLPISIFPCLCHHPHHSHLDASASCLEVLISRERYNLHQSHKQNADKHWKH